MNNTRALRIVITGPESSGKSSLAQDLGHYFGVGHVEEYARAYLDQIQRAYTQADLDIIALEQLELQSEFGSERLQICDTGPLVLKIWSLEMYKNVSRVIEDYSSTLHVDLFIICLPDIPWEADHQRVNPLDRDRLFDRYIHELLDMDVPIFIVSGTLDHRLSRAIMAIDGLIP